MYRSQAEEAQAAWLLSASRSVDSNERRFQCLRPLACRQRKKYDWLVGVLVFPFFIFGFRCSLRLGASQTDSRCGKAYTTSLNSRLKNWKRIKCSYLCVGVEDFFLRRAREDLFRLTLRRVMVDPMRKSLFSYSPYSISSYSACSRYIYSLMRCSFSAYRRYIYFVRRCSFSACWRYIYFVRRCSFSACRRYIYSVRRCSYSSSRRCIYSVRRCTYSSGRRYIYSLRRCSFSVYRRYIYSVRRCTYSACKRYIYSVRRCSFSACRRYIYSVRRCSYSACRRYIYSVRR